MNGQLSASDVMALTKDNDGFGGVGLIILLFIFLIGIGGNGFGYGNAGTGLALADIQASLYNQTATITDLFNQQTINELRDKLATTRDELSNTRQTAVITENILSNLSVTAPKPPCYYPCCNRIASL